MSTYQVVAPLVILCGDDGVYRHLYQGAVVDAAVAKDRLQQLAKDGMVVKQQDDGDTKPAGDTVAEVLASVGEDREKAAAALAAENAKPDPRPSLIKKLTAIAEPDPQAGS